MVSGVEEVLDMFVDDGGSFTVPRWRRALHMKATVVEEALDYNSGGGGSCRCVLWQ